jgi:6-phosphogluconate dehydrogenase
MKLGYIGLGKMGENMVYRLLEKGHQVIAWNRSPEPRQRVLEAGAETVDSIEAMIEKLETPRLIWVMLPSGKVTEEMMGKLADLLDPQDIVVNGANEFYKDSARYAITLENKGIKYLGVGVSGGPGGARHGACLMIGGHQDTYQPLKSLFEDLAAPNAYQFFDGFAAGHFVKMVHNGIEYGMMQAIAEGFEVLKRSEFNLDLVKVAAIYNNQSVIESRLVEWAKAGFEQYGQDLDEITPTVSHSGEGEWTIQAAKEFGIAVPIIEGSFQYRVESAKNPSFTGKVLTMLRHMFGGHEAKVN